MREWLKKIRENIGLTQQEVAEKSDMSQQYYGFIESGERGEKLPVQTAKKIAEVLGFNWQLFYEEREAG